MKSDCLSELAGLINNVNFSSVSIAILAISLSIISFYIILKGVQFIIFQIRGYDEDEDFEYYCDYWDRD